MQTSSKVRLSHTWTDEQDRELASIVLDHMRTGRTQLSAFEEAATRFGRTSAGCGFRWNAMVRKQYVEQIRLAKSERITVTASKPQMVTSSSAMPDVVQLLRRYDASYQELRHQRARLEQDCDTLRSRLESLQVHSQKEGIVTPEQLEADAVTLLQIMQRARGLIRDIV